MGSVGSVLRHPVPGLKATVPLPAALGFAGKLGDPTWSWAPGDGKGRNPTRRRTGGPSGWGLMREYGLETLDDPDASNLMARVDSMYVS